MIPERAREILADAERVDGTPPVSDQALLALDRGRRRRFDAEDAVGILGEGELDLVVRPSARGRGIGTALLDEMLRAHDREGPEDPLRVWAHGENPAATALLRRTGFSPVRLLLRLALDPGRLPAAVAAARPVPPDTVVRAFDPARPEDAADWVRVNAAAFAAHPEQGAVTAEDFRLLAQEPWFDPDDLLLAFRTGGGTERLVGYGWVKTLRDAGRTETELYVLGVDPEAAGRGLGGMLLGAALRRMAVRDPERITLYVDGDNAGARRLYERAGFTEDQRSTQWLRRPPAAQDPDDRPGPASR